MKKIIHKVREHAHILDHHHQQQQQQQQQQQDETLKTSPYEDAALRTPPTVGERPLGSNMDPEPPRARRKTLSGPGPTGGVTGVSDRLTAPAPAPVTAPITGDAPNAFPNQPGQPPINYSRLPPRKADPLSTAAGEPHISHEGHQRSVTPSPSAIQPHDLADPEYSYLSRVYPMSPANKDDSTRRRSVSAAHPQTIGMPDTAYPASPSRRQPYPSAAATYGSPDALPSTPTIPRKEVGSGLTGPHHNRTSLGSARSGTTDYSAHETSTSSPSRALDGTAESSGTIIDLGTTVDTEVITKEARAVVRETVVPKVHEIREEVITREIHKHYIIHRVLPVIDVEVLPPRHFVPAADGTLVEVSADQIPGRLGHWGIVETVTRPPGATPQNEPLPFMPVAGGVPTTVSTTTTTVRTEHGDYPRTETVIRHPPKLSTAARDAGESWPILIDPQHYAEKHGLPITAAIAKQGTMKPLPRIGDASAVPAASTSSYPATARPGNHAAAGPLLPQPDADIVPRIRDYAPPVLPGVFPPAVYSAAAYNTFPEPPSQPPPPPPKD